MDKFNVTIKGMAPLLQHRFHVENEDPVFKEHTGFRDFSNEVLLALYITDEQVVYQPSDHVLGAMTKSAVDFKIPGKNRKTYKDLIQSAVIVEPDFIPHKIAKWVVDRRPVRIKMARIVRERPRFDEWELDFQITILDKQLPSEVVLKILQNAGYYKGIGDYRPRFGRFQVLNFDKVEG